MGDPPKQRKKFETPLRPWEKTRIEEERELLREYGLRRKREIWRVDSLLRNFRRRARELLAKESEKAKTELIEKLNRLGVVKKNAELEDVLALTTKDLLERRLQTIIVKKGLANTVKEARQLIVHGHVTIDGRKVRKPSALVYVDKEDKISTTKPKTKKLKEKTVKKTEKKEDKKEGESAKEGKTKDEEQEGKNESGERESKEVGNKENEVRGEGKNK